MKQLLIDYFARHRHPANLWLHIVGVPATLVLPVVLWIWQAPLWALASFVAGYVMQFAGHAIEGNDPGEVIVIKKLLGKPYVGVVPRADKVRVRD